jgi:hypothetical protein
MGERGPVFSPVPACNEGADDTEASGTAAACCFYLCEEVCPTGAISSSFEIVLGEGLSADEPVPGTADL